MEDKVISQAQYTIVDLNDGVDGVDGYTVILTNESHAIQCDFLGNPLPGEIGFASSKANSTIIVYKGEQKLSAIGLSDAMALGKFKYSLEPKTSSSTCLGDRATNDKFYLKELYSDSGSLLINITLDNNQTVVREFTWTKAKHGEDAKYIKLRYNNVFKYPNKTSTTPTPTSIDISMDIFNITNYSIAWKYLNSSGSYVDVVSGTGCVISSDKKTLTINDRALFVNDICKIKAICTDTTYNKQYVDEAIIYKQYDGNDGNNGNDGADAYSCVLTNESDTILFDQNGTIKPGQINSTTCKASSSIMVKKGTQTLNPVSESATPGTGQYKFKFEPAPINCTVARNGDSAFYITGLTSGKDNGKVSVSIYLEGNTNKIVKEYTWNKVIDGVDARFVTVEGEDKFSYDNSSDTTPTPTSIVLTATAQNIPSPTYKWQYYNGTLVDIVSGAGSLIENNRLTIDDKKLFPNGVKTAKIQCSVTYNGITYSDTKSIIKVYDGDQGEVGPPGSDSKTVIISGQNQIKYDKNNTPIPSSITLTATPNNYKSPTYKWYYVTSSGANLISGQTTNKLSVAHNSAWFASDIALIRVECRESNGSDLSSFDFSITRSYDGSDATSLTLNITGGTRNVCYNGKNNLLTTVINPFTIELYEDTTNVSTSSNVRSITWSCSGHYTIGSANVGAVNFKPTPINTYDETKLDTSVSVTVNYNGRVIKQIVPVSVSKNSTALDWVEEWDGSKVEVGGVQIISPKIFAGKKDTQTGLLTGIALGQDIVNKNNNIGMAIYYNNKLLGRINADPSVDNNNILVLGALEGKQFTLNTSGEVVIGGGLKVSVGSTTTTVSDISNTANKGVSDAANASALASNAQTNASKAQSTADGAKSQAQDAINRHNDLASDSKLTPVEKQQVFADFEEIKKEKVSIDKQADVYGVSKANFTNRYNELNTYLYGSSGLLTSMNTTSNIVRTDFTTKFNNYYTERQNVLDLVASKTKEYATTIVDNISIGTRNLLLNTSKDFKTVTFSGWDNYLQNLNFSDYGLKPGEKLTARIYFKPASYEVRVHLDFRNEAESSYYQYMGNVIKPNEEGYSVLTTEIPTTAPNGEPITKVKFSIRHSTGTTPSNVVQYKEAKLEKGTKATDYTQAPEDIDNNIREANQKGQEAINKHNDMANDNKLTPVEKQTIKREMEVINGEKQKIIDQANILSITTQRDAYITAYNNLNTYVSSLISNTTTTSDINGTTHRAKFADYYNKRQDLLNAISTKLKAIGDNAQGSADTANRLAQTAQNSANDAQSSANIANNKHAELASDNKLTPSEKKSSKKEWDIIVSEKSKIEGEASRYGVSVSNYQTKYNTLNNYITPILTDLNTTSDIVGTTYRLTFKEYYDARQDVLNSITTKAKQLADSAQTSANAAQSAANNAQSTANTAQSNANTANTLLSDIANDNKLTSSEKKVTKLEWDVIVNEKDKIVADATKYSQSTTDYVNKYNALNTYITPILSNINTTSDIVGTTFRTNFANYYSSRQDLLNAISAKSKELADNAQSSANTANSIAQSAQTAANNAQSSANTANNKHAELSNDNKLTAIEKHSTKKEWDVIVSEKAKIESEANKFGVSLTTYQSKYNDLNTYITPLLSNLSATSDIVGTTYRQKFKDYYDARQDVLNSITSKAKQLADNAQSSANNANNKADQLNTWKKEAEQKITPEAITNTVKSAVDVDGQQLFAKMADVKITAENMIATFSEVGGVNLLRNTEFKSHTNGVVDFWYPLRWDASAGGNHSINVRPLGNQWALNNRRTLHGAVNGLPTTAIGKNLTAGFDSEYFEVQPNQTYTLGCLIAAHRTKDVTIEMLCFDANGNRLMGDNHACWIQDIFNYNGGNDRKNWKRIVHRWTPQENAAKCILRAFMGEYLGGEDSALFWIAEPVVVKGVVDPIWTVSSDENYTGIVKSDKDGVEVEMKDGEGSQGKALLGYQGLEIFDSGGHRKAWFGNNDSAQIDKLKVNSISNRHMLKWSEDRPFEFYVASSSTGDGSGRDPSNKSNSINNVLNWIWNNYGVYSWRKDLNIFCDPGTYNENIVITGWLGSGVIRIYFHPDSTWYGQHTIEDNTMAVYLLCRGTNDSMQWNNHGQMFRFRSSENNGYMFRIRNSVVWLVGGRFCKEGWSGGFNEWYGYDFVFMLAYCGAKVYLSNNDVVGFYKYLEVNDCSFVVTYQNRGHCYKFASVNYGGLLNGMGRIPMHSGGAESYNGGKWWDLGDVGGHNSMWQPKDTAPPPPPAPTYQWMEGSFGTSGLRTAPEGSGSGTTARNGEWGQGKWGSYKPHRGYADLGGGPSNWCGGGDNYRNVNAWITLTRLGTSHGIAGATPRPRFKEPNGNFWDCGVGFARGETKTIQLPSSIANAIANGSMQTLEMWAGTSTNDYSFYNNTSVRIKCEKKV